MIKVYIASPYTNGWHADNVKRQLDAMKILMDNGFVPFAPLLTHFCEIHHGSESLDWFGWELEWLKLCDVLVRIRPDDKDGNEIPSPGSDIEVETAYQNAVTVYNLKNLDELEEWAQKYKESDSKE